MYGYAIEHPVSQYLITRPQACVIIGCSLPTLERIMKEPNKLTRYDVYRQVLLDVREVKVIAEQRNPKAGR